MLILGGLVVIALFAALLAPWFINWDDYKGNFQAEAEKILGQPVRVVGSAKASILPSPSLTFTNVEVGDTEGQPMMTV
ncbi:MAG: AsmA family protein, partial [Bauldia sp.]